MNIYIYVEVYVLVLQSKSFIGKAYLPMTKNYLDYTKKKNLWLNHLNHLNHLTIELTFQNGQTPLKQIYRKQIENAKICRM